MNNETLKIKNIIHKTCASWGETVCGKEIFAVKSPKITERWDRTTCKKCLSYKHNKQG